MTHATDTFRVTSDAQAWVERAPEIAQWIWDHLVNRGDAWGKYLTPAERRTKHRADGSPYVESAMTAKGELTLEVLTTHVRGADLGDLIGLHSTSLEQSCRWGGIDVDQHSERDDKQAEANWRFVLHVLAKLETVNVPALVLDSNGRGGFHVMILFNAPVPARALHRWLKLLVSDAEELGITEIEVFPKQPKIAGYGNWLRLPGRHHTHEHWTKVWANGTWFEGEEAIDLILSHELAPASLIQVQDDDLARPDLAHGGEGDGLNGDGEQRRLAGTEAREAAQAALRHIPNDDLPYDQWVRVGSALHHVGDDMLDCWVRWSGSSSKHVHGECERAWQYFKRYRGPDVPTATLHTLLKMAAERGWRSDAPANAPRFKTVGELCADHPELRPPVIYGLLRSGESGNLVAGPKSNKSWLMIQLAISIVTGRMWLGRFQVISGPVLILDNEFHEENVAHRIPKVAAAMGVSMAELRDRLCVESLRGRLKDIHGLASYFAGIEAGRFKLIVLDALYRLLPQGIDENSNADMAAVYNAIDRYAAQLGCAFMLVHHSSKGLQSHKAITDVGAGAGAQSRATDAHIILRPHEQDGCVVVDAVVRSWPPVEPFVARWEYPIWKPAAELDPTLLKRDTRRRSEQTKPVESPKPEPWTAERFVTAFVTEAPQLKAEIVLGASLQDLSERKASRLLVVAERAGLVHRWTPRKKTEPLRFATVPQPLIEVPDAE